MFCAGPCQLGSREDLAGASALIPIENEALNHSAALPLAWISQTRAVGAANPAVIGHFGGVSIGLAGCRRGSRHARAVTFGFP